MRHGCLVTLLMVLAAACAKPLPQWGYERELQLSGSQQTWAVAPVLDLSGRQVDPILHADRVFEQLQQVRGLVVVPVNRVVEAMVRLGLTEVGSAADAEMLCRELRCDGIVLTSVTIHDPYNPPKLGASISLYRVGSAGPAGRLDVTALTRQASVPGGGQAAAAGRSSPLVQAVGLYDASNGSTRDALRRYAAGRHDPLGPLGWQEYLLSMDRFSGFVYHDLAEKLLAALSAGAG